MGRGKLATSARNETIKFDFSISRKDLPPDQFFRFMEEYPDKSQVLCHLYRTGDPVIDRTLVGLEKLTIAVESNPITLEWIKQEFGSGTYFAMFNDDSRPAANNQNNVCKCTFTIREPNMPPKYNPAELDLEVEANRRYIDKALSDGWMIEDFTVTGKKGERITRRRLVRPEDAKPHAPAAPTAAPQFSGSDPMGKLLPMILEAVKPKGDPLEQAFEIAKRLTPPPPPDPFQTVNGLVSLMREIRQGETAHEPVVLPPQKSFAENLKELTETAAMLGFKKPGGAQIDAGGSWMEMATAFFQNVPGMIQAGANLFTAIAAMKHGAEFAKVAPKTQPIPEIRGGAPGSTQTEVTQEMPQPDFTILARVGKGALDSFSKGQSGDEYADQLCSTPAGEQDYDHVFSLGKENLVNIAKQFGLMGSVPPDQLPLLLEWFDAFFFYGDDSAEEETPAATPEPGL